MCDRLEDNDRGYHIGLYSKNYDGVLELNSLLSKSKSKGHMEDNSDRHTYHNPRLSLDEVMNTTDNIIVTTACIQSMLFQYEKYAKNALALESEDIKISQSERARITKIKLDGLNEDELIAYKKLKAQGKVAFLSKIDIDCNKLSEYYITTRNKFLDWLAEKQTQMFF